MGRAKKKRMAKLRRNREEHNLIRLKMGKRIFFNLTKCNKKMSGISNRVCYKSNMHGLIYKDAHFQNVRYRASIITKCNFNKAVLNCVDFCNCNLKNTSFKDAVLRNVCFFTCNLSGVDFTNAKFENVFFVCTGVDKAKGISPDASLKRYTTYPQIDIDDHIQAALLQLSDNRKIFESRIIHVSKGKLNMWTIEIITDLYGRNSLEYLIKLTEEIQSCQICTIGYLIDCIEKYSSA